jgi:uncharacterized membrane protein (UPF0127 family)
VALFRIVNQRNGALLGHRVARAESFFARLLGLLPRSGLQPGEGLILPGCSQIHMFGMRFAIDLLFLDEKNLVLETIPAIKPWQISPGVSGAVMVVELPCGVIVETETEPGDQLQLIREETC